jgi:hypothetical protein
MAAKLIKMITLLIIGSCFLNSCQLSIFNTSDTLQVYNENGTLYKGYHNLVGVPLIPHSISDLPWNPDSIFRPGTSTSDLGVYPWTITGKIRNGKMAIAFPNGKLELNTDFENSFTDGVRICIVYIENKNSGSMKYGLHKIESDDFSRVYIYYSSDDFIRPHNEIALKAGWNFIEELENPKWFYGSDEPWSIIGLISQDINDFLKKGYRWQLEMWF